jgi:Spy/CpxP family protein refolding chaperone
MRRNLLLAFLGLVLLGTGGISRAWAQHVHEFGGGHFQDRFMEIKRQQLGPALGVDQRTVDRLLAIDQRYNPIRHRLITEMRADMQRLQQLMSQPVPSQRDVQTVLNHMKRKRLEMLNLQQRKDQEETALLTPVQQARYIMYLIGLVRQARSIKSAPGGPTGPGTMGGPGNMAPAFRPREIPVSRPPR